MADEDAPEIPSPRSKERASEACRSCHQKKAKCNVTVTGVPCSNCSKRGHPEACVLRTRKPYPPRRSRKDLNEVGNGSEPSATSIGQQSATQSAQKDFDARVPTASDSTIVSPSSGEKPGSAIVAALLGDRTEVESEAPYFVGDEQGIGYILDVFEPGRLLRGKHYLIPRSTVKALSPEDLRHLKAKGVFSLPEENICESLLRCFFHHVHPNIPVVDVNSVLGCYLDGGAKKVNLLLLWSMFSVAANFVDDECLRSAGFATRKDMKESMYRRAKTLYDCEGEDNRIVIVQSVILMSFRFVDTEEKASSWHWMGTAISHAQTLGLHRDPDSGQRNPHLNDKSRPLWRRIWWSCFYRDRWLSLFMGRPMRINLRDCDIPMPSPGDIMGDLVDLSPAAWNKFMPCDFNLLAEGWTDFIRLSKVLGEILAANYAPNSAKPSLPQIETFENEIYECSLKWNQHETKSRLHKFYASHFGLYQQAAIIALYRPFAVKGLMHGSVVSEETRLTARQRVKAAASKTNSILESIISEDTIRFMGPMTVPLLVPAMQTHLLESRSRDQLSRSMGLYKLELCMMVIREVESIYPAAKLIRGIFLEAVERLNASHKSLPTSMDTRNSGEMAPEFANQANENLPSLSDVGLEDTWMNEATFLDPWNSNAGMPQMTDALLLTPEFDINTVLSDDEFQKLFFSMQDTLMPQQ